MRNVIALLIALVVSGCAFSWIGYWLQPADLTSNVAQGDAVRGEDIFRHGKGSAPPCMTCHALSPGGFSLGPVMKGISARAGQRTAGLDANAYLRQSILDPKAFIVPGYRDIMFPGYADRFTEQDVADLIAYLLTL
jgi:cytochrome c2